MAAAPRAIGIVDGYFARVPAVWHKEIMWVMEHGVHVFGGAGLGALRAAELDQLRDARGGAGLPGVPGRTVDRDDEVAVGVGPPRRVSARSEPMVNIRATLRSAASAGSSPATHDRWPAPARAVLSDRSWPGLLDVCRGAGRGPGRARRAAAVATRRASRSAGRGRHGHAARDASFLATDPAPLQVRWNMAPTARWAEAMASAEATAGEAGGVR